MSLVEDRVPTAGGKSSAESTSSINSCCGGTVGAYTAYIRALQRLTFIELYSSMNIKVYYLLL